ncbi:MAG: tRNA preQ1(34) S-adenosylmethionine ribosyltransferase-isomerase QueA [Patescibacteria group bacterium]|nr:tRNA preQ1(34) S-adenosylmethionine ribosyltransferase-isomerase QueA [Patescibacteria group bacterium]MDD4695504.1 tRNA preQ1(34) S-adenosylmethionine ribosyltransferase-isomerase QueA [Patescibacteria group bacterium]
MKLSEFNYNLPKNLIANCPASPRDSSRLLISNYKSKKFEHHIFKDIYDILECGDILVFNNTKVFPARLFGTKESGGKMEVFLLREISRGVWSAIIGGCSKNGLKINFNKEVFCNLVEQEEGYVWKIKFNKKGKELNDFINKFGHVPIPPYIKNPDSETKLKKEYQTVYARVKGSVAAPTAGFHFTKELMNKLKKKGIIFKYVTLHVGLGTFEPVKTDRIEDHKIHSEFGILDKGTAKFLNKAKKQNKKIVVVGTTALRVLEAFSNDRGELIPQKNWINIFIYPGYKFKFVNNLITNFHLPKSTLLMLISALAGKKFVDKLYKEAIKNEYRFYSFGDAMFFRYE